MKNVLNSGKRFLCERCAEVLKGIVEPEEELSFLRQVELVKSFCFSWNRLNASGGSETAMVVKTRIEWINLEDVGNCLMEESFH